MEKPKSGQTQKKKIAVVVVACPTCKQANKPTKDKYTANKKIQCNSIQCPNTMH